MIRTLSSSALLYHILVSLKIPRSARMDGSSISLELSSTLTPWLLAYQKTNTIVQSPEFNVCSLPVPSLIVRSKNFSDSFHFVQKLFPSEDPFYAISSISFNDYHTYTQMQ